MIFILMQIIRLVQNIKLRFKKMGIFWLIFLLLKGLVWLLVVHFLVK